MSADEKLRNFNKFKLTAGKSREKKKRILNPILFLLLIVNINQVFNMFPTKNNPKISFLAFKMLYKVLL